MALFGSEEAEMLACVIENTIEEFKKSGVMTTPRQNTADGWSQEPTKKYVVDSQVLTDLEDALIRATEGL